MALLVVHSAGSGDVLAEFGVDEFQKLVETHGDTVRALKIELQGRGFCCRFRLRILNDSAEMQDDEKLMPQSNLKLVQMNLSPPDEVENEIFFEACEEGLPEEVEKKLNKCQDPNAAVVGGVPALHQASFNGHLEVVRLLLEAGASCNQTANQGKTPLICAAENGHMEVVRLLLEAGSSCDQAMTDDGTTALLLAVENGHLAVVRWLLEAGAFCDRARTDDGTTSLMLAAEDGHLQLVRLLVDAGASCNKPSTDDGKTALHLAAEKGHLDVVRLLLDVGAFDQARTHVGQTPVHVATEYGHNEVVRLLREKRRKVTST